MNGETRANIIISLLNFGPFWAFIVALDDG